MMAFGRIPLGGGLAYGRPTQDNTKPFLTPAYQISNVIVVFVILVFKI
jgi:hypothetical protein